MDVELIDLVLTERRAEVDRARIFRDDDAERFWMGVVRAIEAMQRDEAEWPRDVPEVWAYLARALRSDRSEGGLSGRR